MNRTLSLKKSLLGVGIAGLMVGVAGPASAVTIQGSPFTQNFDAETPGNTNLATLTKPMNEAVGNAGTAADYTITAAASGNTLQGLVQATTGTNTTGVPANVSASVPVTDVPTAAGNGFSLSSDFTIDSFTRGGSASTLNFGLAALGTNTNFSTGGNYRLLYTVAASTGTGQLSLSELAPAGNTAFTQATSGTSTVTPSAGLTGTLTLRGIYNSTGGIDLVGTLESGGTTLMLTATDSTPEVGTNFGYRTALNAQLGSAGTATASNMDIRYDNLNISAVVPEPGSLTLLALAGVAMLRRRRR